MKAHFKVVKGKLNFEAEFNNKHVKLKDVKDLKEVLDKVLADLRPGVNIFTIVNAFKEGLALRVIKPATKPAKGVKLKFGALSTKIDKEVSLELVLADLGVDLIEELRTFYLEFFQKEFLDAHTHFNKEFDKFLGLGS